MLALCLAAVSLSALAPISPRADLRTADARGGGPRPAASDLQPLGAGACAPAEQRAKLTASDADAVAAFGRAVALDGDTALIGATGDDELGPATGAAHVFVRDGDEWSEQAKLTVFDVVSGGSFGRRVALHGDTAVVTAFSDDGPATVSGSAWVFLREGTDWSLEAELTVTGAEAFDQLGFGVSVSGDTVLLGAVGDDGAGLEAGSAHVFVRDGVTWSEQAELFAPDAEDFDDFGFAVALSGDTAVVGAIGDDDGGDQSGSAHVFVRSGTAWEARAKLTAADASAGDSFGWSVALDGDTAVIGAPADDDGGMSSGSAYVFVRGGAAWSEQAKVTAADAVPAHGFGESVSISGDVIVVGARRDEHAGRRSGAAYVFVRTGTTWSQQAKLTADDAAPDDSFGDSVAVSGEHALVGAFGDDDHGDTSGAAYVFGCRSAGPCTAGPDVRAGCDGVSLSGASTGASGDARVSWSSDCGASFSPGSDVLAPTVFLGGDCGAECELTFTVDDGSGAACTDTVTVTVVDDLPPRVQPLEDATVECDAVPEPEAPDVRDDCDPAPRLELREELSPGRCRGEATIVRTWTATDACGNAGTARRHLEVVDTTPPVIAAGDDVLACLWAPRHAFACLEPDDVAPVITDGCGGEVTWRFGPCTSSQQEDGVGTGDGRSAPDCVVASDGSLCARSERDGTDREGRVYAVSVIATDDCGNESEPVVIGRILVGHDRRDRPPCRRPGVP